MTSTEARSQLVAALRLDLIGPSPGDELESEILPSPPSRWYLTGFLVPHEAAEEVRRDETADEQLELAAVNESGDDDAPAEQVSKRKAFFPSSIGISALVRSTTDRVTVTAEWGDYKANEIEDVQGKRRTEWNRAQRTAKISVPLGGIGSKPKSFDIPDSDGLRLVVSLRKVTPTVARAIAGGTEPCDCRAMSAFLVNQRSIDAESKERKDEKYVFQAGLRVVCEDGFVPRPDLRGTEGEDRDERIADLQHRDTFEYAVGHGISTHALVEGGLCREIRTEWIPEEDVERVQPAAIPGVELRMEPLAAANAGELADMLAPLLDQYALWTERQRKTSVGGGRRQQTLDFLVDRASNARRRISEGVTLLSDPQILEAFQIANRAMAAAARQRQIQAGQPPTEPAWRPFQLAFILMNLRGNADPTHFDREVVDLLFFPTGGGKTEAYLGLAAFTLALRRLRNPGVQSAGVSVLMRYTLRLLTLDQLARGATMICALELERKQAPE